MGKLGFLFEIDRSKDNIVFFNDKILENDKIVVFIERPNLEGDYIASLKKKSIKEANYCYLGKDLSLKPYFVFENPKFKIGKISLNHEKFIDFEYLTFWFGVRQYKHLWDLLVISDFDNLEEELKIRTLKVAEFF